MKRACTLFLALAAGCSSGPDADPDAKQPEAARPAPPGASPKEAEISATRQQLATKKAELTKATADLESLAAERQQLDGEGASEKKTTRLADIATLESEGKRKRQALAIDIAELEAKLKDLSVGSKQSDDP